MSYVEKEFNFLLFIVLLAAWLVIMVCCYESCLEPPYLSAPSHTAPLCLAPCPANFVPSLVSQAAENNTDLTVFNIEELLSMPVRDDSYYGLVTFGSDDIIGDLSRNLAILLARHTFELSKAGLLSPNTSDVIVVRVLTVWLFCYGVRSLAEWFGHEPKT